MEQVTTKNPKKVEAGRKGAEARKAKHEQMLEKLRAQNRVLDEEEQALPPCPIPDYTYIVAGAVAIAGLGGLAIYHFRSGASQSAEPQNTEPLVPRVDPFNMI